MQTHCHQHAVLSDGADRVVLRRAGVDADVLDEGRCGLVGNVGFERGHHELSMKVAERGVLPAVRAAAPGALVVAGGFSCRTRIEQGCTGRRALHLAEVLALGLDPHVPADHPEKAVARPVTSRRDARAVTAAAAAAALGGAAGVVVRLLRSRRAGG